ncbi:MAG: hypothetical protein Q7S03_01070 [bacterium]|nr:hypothetical protein [bacterium]
MEEDNSFAIFIAVVIIVVGLFYWFYWRPFQIRKECYEYAHTTPNLGDTNEWKLATNYYYEACLKRNGLED